MAGDLAALTRSAFFRRLAWKRNLYIVLALLLDLAVIAVIACLHINTRRPEGEGAVEILGYYVHFAFDRESSYVSFVVVVLVQFGLGHWALRQSLEADGMVTLYPEDKSEGRKFGGFDGPQLVRMVQELADRMHRGKVRRIVVSDRPDPNAYTAHILGYGNIVVLHGNLLEILPPAGVRAVVAHEVAHMKSLDSLVYQIAALPRSFILLMSLVILAKVGVGVFQANSLWDWLQRLAFLWLAFLLALTVFRWLQRVANLAAQQSEHLADAYAAAVCGWNPMLNALLVIGQRSAALQTIMLTLKKQAYFRDVNVTEDQVIQILKRLPPRELDEHKAGKLASRLYIESRLAELQEKLCVPLAEGQIVDLAAHAAAELRRRQEEEERQDPDAYRERQEKEQEEAELEKLLIDWRRYDRDRSGHLDPRETAALVEDLRGQPDKMLFRELQETDGKWGNHPTIRDRVLRLYDGFRQVSPPA